MSRKVIALHFSRMQQEFISHCRTHTIQVTHNPSSWWSEHYRLIAFAFAFFGKNWEKLATTSILIPLRDIPKNGCRSEDTRWPRAVLKFFFITVSELVQVNPDNSLAECVDLLLTGLSTSAVALGGQPSSLICRILCPTRPHSMIANHSTRARWIWDGR